MKGKHKALKVLIRRLIEWLQVQGLPPEKIIDCLNYILGK